MGESKKTAETRSKRKHDMSTTSDGCSPRIRIYFEDNVNGFITQGVGVVFMVVHLLSYQFSKTMQSASQHNDVGFDVKESRFLQIPAEHEDFDENLRLAVNVSRGHAIIGSEQGDPEDSR